MVLDVRLISYPIAPLEQQFSIQINPDDGCTITGLALAPGQDTTINYEIVEPAQAQIVPFPDLTVTPSTCFQTFSYEIVLAGTTDRPAFATITENGI